MATRLFPRDGKWYCWVTKRFGGQRKLTTGIDVPSGAASPEDRRKAKLAAESVAVDLQARELDPERAAQEKASLQDAFGVLMRELAAEAKAGSITKETLRYYRSKSGSVLAILAEVLQRSPNALIRLHEVKPALVDDYITLRREIYGTDDSTIGKELNVWKRAMKVAKRRGWWPNDVDAVFPEFSAASNTVERWCSPAELQKLYQAIVRPRGERTPKVDHDGRAELYRRYKSGEDLKVLAKEAGVSYAAAKRYIRPFREADSAPRVPLHGRPPVGPSEAAPLERKVIGHGFFAIICFSIATSAEWSALWRTLDVDIADDLRLALVRGSKNENRVDRSVPVEFFPFALLLGFAKSYGDGVERDEEGRRFLFGRTHQAAFRRTLKEACARAGIPPLTPNDLRRSHAKWLRLAGVSPAVIAPSMGHVDSRMVELRYGKASAVELAAVQRAELTNAGWVSDAVRVSTGLLMGRATGNLLHAAPVLARPNQQITGEFVAGAGGLEPTTCGFGIPDPAKAPNSEPSVIAHGDEAASDSACAEPTLWAANGQSTACQRTGPPNREDKGIDVGDPAAPDEAPAHGMEEDKTASLRTPKGEAIEPRPGLARAPSESGVRVLDADAISSLRGGLASGRRR